MIWGGVAEGGRKGGRGGSKQAGVGHSGWYLCHQQFLWIQSPGSTEHLSWLKWPWTAVFSNFLGLTWIVFFCCFVLCFNLFPFC